VNPARQKGASPRQPYLHQDVATWPHPGRGSEAKVVDSRPVGGDKGSVCSPYLLTPFPLGFCTEKGTRS